MALVAHVENAGVAVKVNAHAATFSDPDGFPIELLEARTAKTDLHLSVMDERKTAALYAGVFGIQQSVPETLVGIVFARAKSQDELSLPFPSPGQGMVPCPCAISMRLPAPARQSGLR
jgi:hypothetical protein